MQFMKPVPINFLMQSSNLAAKNTYTQINFEKSIVFRQPQNKY